MEGLDIFGASSILNVSYVYSCHLHPVRNSGAQRNKAAWPQVLSFTSVQLLCLLGPRVLVLTMVIHGFSGQGLTLSLVSC